MQVRGVRGATTVPSNDQEAILGATRELLKEMVSANRLDINDLACATFTVTDDLDAAFPAAAARQMGWEFVPLLDTREIPVPGSLERCIRILLLWNTECSAQEVHHIYQREARRLRPDLVQATSKSEEAQS